MIYPMFLFGLGPLEVAIVVGLMLLLFGYKLVPIIAKRAGQVAERTRHADEDFKAGKEESQ